MRKRLLSVLAVRKLLLPGRNATTSTREVQIAALDRGRRTFYVVRPKRELGFWLKKTSRKKKAPVDSGQRSDDSGAKM